MPPGCGCQTQRDPLEHLVQGERQHHQEPAHGGQEGGLRLYIDNSRQ